MSVPATAGVGRVHDGGFLTSAGEAAKLEVPEIAFIFARLLPPIRRSSLKRSLLIGKMLIGSASETDFRKRLMNGPTSTEPVEKTVPLAAERSEGRPSAEKGSSTSQPSKLHVRADADAERMSSMLIRMISNSVGELEGLIAELQEAQAFLKSEGERIQREITNYAQLNQSALVAIRVITDTVGPWKSAVLEHDCGNSDANSVLHGSELIASSMPGSWHRYNQ